MDIKERLSERINIFDVRELILVLRGDDVKKCELFELMMASEDVVAYQAAWVWTHFPPTYHNLMVTHTGGGARPRKLANKMSEALLNFMKKGDPSGGELPKWPRYTSEKGEVMILNDVCGVKNDPDREARATLG